LLPLLAVNYVVIYASRLIACALRARRETQPIFRGHLYAGVVGLAVGWLLVLIGGVEGAALGMVIGAAVGLTVVLRAFVAGSATPRDRRAGLESVSGDGAA
jgi:Na+-driven multidrug efflux pump